jgi:hypothetical protein
VSLQGVRWAEDVVDNELMNKKKSKSECNVVTLTAKPTYGHPARPALDILSCLTLTPHPACLQSAAFSTRSVSLASGATAMTVIRIVTALQIRMLTHKHQQHNCCHHPYS